MVRAFGYGVMDRQTNPSWFFYMHHRKDRIAHTTVGERGRGVNYETKIRILRFVVFSSITRFSAIPLSTNSGLIGWVPHCDTLHSLIRDYREKKKILLNIEHRLMLRVLQCFVLSILKFV